MLRCWLLRQLQCKWDSNMWYCVSRYHSSLMTSFLEDIPSWLNFQIAYVALLVAEAVTVQMRQQYVILCFKIPFLLEDIIPWRHHPSWLNFQIAYVALLVAEAVTVQMRQQYVILCFKIPFLLDDIIPWWHHSFLIKLSDCICCAVGWLRQLQCKWDSNMWYCVSRYHSSLMTSFLEDIIPSWLNFQIAYVAYAAQLVAEAVTVQMRQQYVILCFKIPFLLDDIIPWRHHSFLIKLSDCICCAVGCWGSYSANETAICDIVFQDTIPPWWHHSLKTSFLLD